MRETLLHKAMILIHVWQLSATCNLSVLPE